MSKRRAFIAIPVIIFGTLVVTTLVLLTSKGTKSRFAFLTRAQVACDDPNWACGPECAPATVRKIFTDTWGAANAAAQWRTEAAKVYGSCTNAAAPTLAPQCSANKLNQAGACDPACCETGSDCNGEGQSGQKCNQTNGYCKTGKSCGTGTVDLPPQTPTNSAPPTGGGGASPTPKAGSPSGAAANPNGTPAGNCFEYSSVAACTTNCTTAHSGFNCYSTKFCCPKAPDTYTIDVKINASTTNCSGKEIFSVGTGKFSNSNRTGTYTNYAGENFSDHGLTNSVSSYSYTVKTDGSFSVPATAFMNIRNISNGQDAVTIYSPDDSPIAIDKTTYKGSRTYNVAYDCNAASTPVNIRAQVNYSTEQCGNDVVLNLIKISDATSHVAYFYEEYPRGARGPSGTAIYKLDTLDASALGKSVVASVVFWDTAGNLYYAESNTTSITSVQDLLVLNAKHTCSTSKPGADIPFTTTIKGKLTDIGTHKNLGLLLSTFDDIKEADKNITRLGCKSTVNPNISSDGSFTYTYTIPLSTTCNAATIVPNFQSDWTFDCVLNINADNQYIKDTGKMRCSLTSVADAGTISLSGAAPAAPAAPTKLNSIHFKVTVENLTNCSTYKTYKIGLLNENDDTKTCVGPVHMPPYSFPADGVECTMDTSKLTDKITVMPVVNTVNALDKLFVLGTISRDYSLTDPANKDVIIEMVGVCP